MELSYFYTTPNHQVSILLRLDLLLTQSNFFYFECLYRNRYCILEIDAVLKKGVVLLYGNRAYIP